ncbi:hypothetical protein HQ325_13735 [Rhodococcus sp. BP-349]|uniref:hypothetical protein n=1 Tax=unclassified Rhodococcus (in: high G+C Gram-positive bacteria) TaxID=192944 RepID=UPI001C9B3E29|nr:MULTISPECIES: hypothetical protein [unclassified Rhodococcus (in: high G+C Gram-positive bacteria)]MBY6539734.1 hypothetical protein [Rhodococcus sp. BP-363]MBY6543938.1 hypothetical protein [Rhodococcus sp. BP-369]MBY6563168.1 hypothetical protein [Rhodococcus sp. BP-370]MBY6577460.1 hypothetical protein [Rhodococcus sp. BP-364]MBY6586761.1 hypothetical protein [Rhodococcus sp. BP-358]
MTPGHPRREELIAAAVADDLTDAERRELRALEADDPSVADEIRELRGTAGALGAAAGLTWDDAEPGDLLRRRIVRPSGRGRGRLTTAAAAVAGIAVGVAAVLGAQAVDVGDGASDGGAIAAPEVEGPPGELGAFETVDFTETAPDVSVDGGVVAHTWGTETVLEMEGVPRNAAFEVVLVDRAGADRSSGSFLGSAVTIDCRMNAAVLRPDVAEIEIRAAGGDLLARAALPTVG